MSEPLYKDAQAREPGPILPAQKAVLRRFPGRIPVVQGAGIEDAQAQTLGIEGLQEHLGTEAQVSPD